MQDLVVKILPDIELAWRGDKPLLVLLRVIAGMALSQSYMFVELHAAAAAVVVVVAVESDRWHGAVAVLHVRGAPCCCCCCCCCCC